MNNTTNFEYRQLNSKNLVISADYQRELQPQRVRSIVSAFNPNLVNPVKVSFRDGKYYVFDGQHTLAALKLLNGGTDVIVECKVYYGLAFKEEAELFAQQNGISRGVESIAKFKALYSAGDIDIVEMVRIAEKVGLIMDFQKHKGTNRIIAMSKAFTIFKAVSNSDYAAILSLIKDTWGGVSESLNTEILGGVYIFHKLYKGEYKRDYFIRQLSKVSPTMIIREGKSYITGSDGRFAKQIFNAYNKNLSSNRLADKF